jgi:uncharacterized metal-binding protein
MPNARTHDKITVATGLLLTPLCYALLTSAAVDPAARLAGTALYASAHMVSGMLFSPDLDVDSAIDNRWGIYYWIWRPYMWLVPHRHRILSHGLVISALLRMLYFYGVLLLLFSLVDRFLALLGLGDLSSRGLFSRQLAELGRSSPIASVCIVAGFISGGDAHVIADYLVTGGKGILRRLGIRVRSYRNHW